MKRFVCGEVIYNGPIADDIFDMRIAEGFIAEHAHPGQFVNVYAPGADTLLPRPLGVCDAHADEGIFRVVYRIAGEGTRRLSALKPGDKIKMTGPAGNGFPIFKTVNISIAGGGTGVPPLLFLARELRGSNRSADISVFLGFRSERQMILRDDFLKLNAAVNVSTDDGSAGFHGHVGGNMRAADKKTDIVYACGPAPMLKDIAAFAETKNAMCFVSLEERMACGVGACLGCVAGVKAADGVGRVYKKVCSDGPVFNAREAVWDG